jgi:hypothetical protein
LNINSGIARHRLDLACKVGDDDVRDNERGGPSPQGTGPPPFNEGESLMTTTLSPTVARVQSKAVVDPRGRWHPSTSAAAIANDVRPSSVSTNCRLGRGGWRYAEPEAPTPAPAA